MYTWVAVTAKRQLWGFRFGGDVTIHKVYRLRRSSECRRFLALATWCGSTVHIDPLVLLPANKCELHGFRQRIHRNALGYLSTKLDSAPSNLRFMRTSSGAGIIRCESKSWARKQAVVSSHHYIWVIHNRRPTHCLGGK